MPSGQAVNPVTGGSWEGVSVKPDGAVPAPQALSKAHRLAVQRLLDETRDPVPPSLLEAVAMKLESLAQAESGEVIRLANAQLIGTYVLLAGQGAAVTIQDRDGRLVQRVSGSPDVRLIFTGGNRYKLEGLPEGSFTSLRLKEGKPQLLREAPGALPRIRKKQATSP
jgi:FtsP/CotA-like multicopper oxidase with cupredoxin domain